MPPPPLPHEIWLKILASLTPPDLDATSLVCKEWHALSTHPVLFRQHLPHLPIDVVTHYTPQALYCRLNSFHQHFYERDIHIDGQLLTVIGDYIVVLHKDHIGALGGDRWIPNLWGDRVAECIVPLLYNAIAIVDPDNRTDGFPRLTIFNLQTSHTKTVNLPPHPEPLTTNWTKIPMPSPKIALPACRGRRICYYSNSHLIVVNLSGTLYHSHFLSPQPHVLSQLLRGEYWHGPTIEGIIETSDTTDIFLLKRLNASVITTLKKDPDEQLLDMIIDPLQQTVLRRSILQIRPRICLIRTKLVSAPRPPPHHEWRMSTSEPPLAQPCTSLSITQSGNTVIYINLPSIRVMYIETGCVQVHQFVSRGAQYDFTGLSFDATHVVTAVMGAGTWGLTALQPVRIVEKGCLGGCRRLIWGGGGVLVEKEKGDWMVCGWGRGGYSDGVWNAINNNYAMEGVVHRRSLEAAVSRAL